MNDPFKLIKRAWSLTQGVPGGKRVFSLIAGRGAPYTGTIGAQVIELEKGRSLIALTQTRRVENHLNSIHAIALANLAEFAGNLAMGFTMPDGTRFIVTRMEIDYVKKARGRVLAEGRAEVPQVVTENIDCTSDVVIRDASGDVVCTAKCFCKVGPTKS